MKNIRQRRIFHTTPHVLYELLMDQEKHSEMTGDKAVISRKDWILLEKHGKDAIVFF